ncbi:MAG: DUF4389 domain-containing protein [Rhodococcus sp. (in: high G+C Gram-positive bacteria)]|uniref:DUF4389 domain-containing protein n=1 Tax=Rhodococcus sp. TaxID=1831 RepID=UPI003BAEA7B2
MKTGKIVLLVIGCLSALIGFALLTASAFLGWAYFAQRDDGYFTSSSERFETSAGALVSDRIELFDDDDLPAGFSAEDLGRVLLRATSEDPNREVFVGIGPRDEVENYLSGVARTEVTEIEFDPFRPTYRQISGDRTADRPADQTFWSESAAGTGTQEVRWDLERGTWMIVVMNADATPGVSVDLQAGAHLAFLGPVALGTLIGAIVLLVIGIPLIVAGAMGLGRHGPPQPHWPATGAPTAVMAAPAKPVPPPSSRPYPAHLMGDLDEPLSRWLWLVKWIMVIPHFVVLFFLGIAFFVTTVVAGFAILFTGRYPRGIFDFNVGVVRWMWRVQFYSYSALGTDRYPPFTLQRTDYPADFEVEYPEGLSRGLVLVKWWLLVIPHYLILAVLAGWFGGWSVGAGGADDGNYRSPWIFGSVLGILVLVAAVVLLFTGRYPTHVFDFVMGINRWAYRVLAYAALMRDEYPPFRLDQGGREPHEYAPVDTVGGPPEPSVQETPPPAESPGHSETTT